MKNIFIFFILLIFCLLGQFVYGQQRDYILLLNGTWKFQLGDSINWSNADYNDNQWEAIQAPSPWEEQGFFGLNGFAWYRKEFTLYKEIENKDIYISLGYIDDVDQVYINGKLIGFSGSFVPKFITALDVERKYPIPQEYLNFQGKNTIAVRVYDHYMSGGIVSGNIGLFTENTIKPDLSLIGIWRFRAGDNYSWKDKNHNDKSWRKMVVPGSWKNHGYKDYTGNIVWYRTSFQVPAEFENQKVAFIAGLIENCDEVFINGVLIGASGNLPPLKKKPIAALNKDNNFITEECSKPRLYLLPDSLLLFEKENTIAIRIYSDAAKGGIIDGPVGFIRQSALNKQGKDKEPFLLVK